MQVNPPMRKNQVCGREGKFVKLLSRRRAWGKVCNGPEWKQLNWGAEQKVQKFRSDFQTLRSVIFQLFSKSAKVSDIAIRYLLIPFFFGFISINLFLFLVKDVVLYIGMIYASNWEKINDCLARCLKKITQVEN